MTEHQHYSISQIEPIIFILYQHYFISQTATAITRAQITSRSYKHKGFSIRASCTCMVLVSTNHRRCRCQFDPKYSVTISIGSDPSCCCYQADHNCSWNPDKHHWKLVNETSRDRIHEFVYQRLVFSLEEIAAADASKLRPVYDLCHFKFVQWMMHTNKHSDELICWCSVQLIGWFSAQHIGSVLYSSVLCFYIHQRTRWQKRFRQQQVNKHGGCTGIKLWIKSTIGLEKPSAL